MRAASSTVTSSATSSSSTAAARVKIGDFGLVAMARRIHAEGQFHQLKLQIQRKKIGKEENTSNDTVFK
jgi:glycine cleavage system pyridoxal-binding protein P